VLSEADIAELRAACEPVDLRYTFFNENTGHGKGQNRLAKDIAGGYLMFLNPDIVLAPDALAELLIPFSSRSDVGITEARQTPFEHPKEYDVKTGETSWASGGCMFIPAALFHQIGGFDEVFFMHCDDVDLSWRVRLTGKVIQYCPSAIVFHDKRLSASSALWMPSEAEKQYSAEGFLLMSHKWSYPKAALAALTSFKLSKSEHHKKAVQNYTRRKADGTLPQPIDPKKTVSEIVKFNYGKMRY
jgi:hypothetical protein